MNVFKKKYLIFVLVILLISLILNHIFNFTNIINENFVDFFEEDKNFPLKKNILATNSVIHEELRELTS